MKVEDITKLDWKKDKSLMAVQAKLEALHDRETRASDRLAALEQIIHHSERLLVQTRADEMLGETSDESAEAIHDRVESARREMAELRASLEALKLAKSRLAPGVEAAAAEARLRVASSLLAPYQQAVSNLKGLLMKAAEENRVLHAIHDLAAKQRLSSELGGNKALKPLTLLLAWNFLTHPNGNDAGEYQYWQKYVDSILGED
jgi:phosphopantetheine adenylyltransferase